MTRDPIDELLERQAPLPDEGFTHRVMAALPAPRPEPGALDRWLPLLGAGLVGAVLAPDASTLARLLASGSGSLAQMLASGAGASPVPLPLLASGVALAAAALGSWLVLEPS
jgi:hypothetical protein